MRLQSCFHLQMHDVFCYSTETIFLLISFLSKRRKGCVGLLNTVGKVHSKVRQSLNVQAVSFL